MKRKRDRNSLRFAIFFFFFFVKSLLFNLLLPPKEKIRSLSDVLFLSFISLISSLVLKTFHLSIPPSSFSSLVVFCARAPLYFSLYFIPYFIAERSSSTTTALRDGVVKRDSPSSLSLYPHIRRIPRFPVSRFRTSNVSPVRVSDRIDYLAGKASVTGHLCGGAASRKVRR